MDDTNKDEDAMLDNAEKQIQNEIILLQEQLAMSREIKRKRELFKETQNKKIEALRDEIKTKTLQYNLEIAYITSQIEELETQIKNTNISKIMDEIDDSVIENVLLIDIANSKDNNNNNNNNNNITISNKKHRTIVKRKPLHEVIKQPTQFKAIIKGTEFRCYTEDGHKIISLSVDLNDSKNKHKTYSSLNEWLEKSIASVLCESENTNNTKKSVYEVVSYYNNTKKEWRHLKTDYTSDTQILN